MSMKSKIMALVPAAGTGTRLGDVLPKQYLDINGMPMIFHALKALAAVKRIDKIVVVLSPEDNHWRNFQGYWDNIGARISVAYVGGKTRGESVANGLAHIEAVLGGRDWLAASRFTVADLIMADVLRVSKLRAHRNRSATEAYVERLTSRPAFRKAYADPIAHFAAADGRRAEGR